LLEQRITALWRDYLSNEGNAYARAVGRAQGQAVAQVLDSMASDHPKILSSFIYELAEEVKIIGFLEEAAKMPEVQPIFLLPHLGFSKLMKEGFAESLGDYADTVLAALPNQEPWLWRLSIQVAAIRSFGIGLQSHVFVTQAYGFPVQQIQRGLPCFLITPGSQGNFHRLMRETGNSSKNSFGFYPEGGTTGKKSEGGIYCLEPFHTGWARFAQQYNRIIIGVAHVVDRLGNSYIRLLQLPLLSTPGKTSSHARTIIQNGINSLLNDLSGMSMDEAQQIEGVGCYARPLG
jgi:hypothetical protein